MTDLTMDPNLPPVPVEIAGGGRRDEIGAMASAVAVFKDNMIEADRLEAAQTAERLAKERRQVAMDQHTQDFGTSISGVMASSGRASMRNRLRPCVAIRISSSRG